MISNLKSLNFSRIFIHLLQFLVWKPKTKVIRVTTSIFFSRLLDLCRRHFCLYLIMFRVRVRYMSAFNIGQD